MDKHGDASTPGSPSRKDSFVQPLCGLLSIPSGTASVTESCLDKARLVQGLTDQGWDIQEQPFSPKAE